MNSVATKLAELTRKEDALSRGDTTGSGREHLIALIWFAVVAAVFLAPVFGGKAFSVVEARQQTVYPWAAEDPQPEPPPQFDSADLTYPWQIELQNALEDKTLAFWSPNVFGGGAPLFSNSTAGQLYPPRTVIYALASERSAHDIYVGFHLLFGGFVAYLLGRELRVSALGSAIVGTAWMLGSFNLAWIHLEVVTSMLVALPLAPLLAHRLWRKRSPGSVALLSVGFSMMLISGHLLWQLLIWIIGAAYSACLGLRSAFETRKAGNTKEAGTHLGLPVVAYLAGLGLSAVVLVPTALNLSQTPRSPFQAEALENFLSPLSVFSTDVLTGPSLDVIDTDLLNYRLAFVGTLTAILALVALVTRRSGSGFVRTLLISTAGVATLWPVARIAYEVIPGMNVFYPYGRLGGWFSLGIALGAGIGFDVISEKIQETSHKWGSLALGVGICLATVAQLVPIGRTLNPDFQTREDSGWFPETPLIAATNQLDASTPNGVRVAPIVLDYAEAPDALPIFRSNHPAALGLDSTSGYDSTLPNPAAEALRTIAGQSTEVVLNEPLVGAFVPSFEIGSSRLDVMRSQGINAVVTVPQIEVTDPRLDPLQPFTVVYSGPDGNLLSLQNADGLASIHPDVSIRSTDADVLEALAVASGGQDAPVLVTETDFADYSTSTSGDASDGATQPNAEVIERGQNTISVSAKSAEGKWLLIAVNYAPGWSASIDGEPVDLVRANHSHMAVFLPVPGSEASNSDSNANSPTVVDFRFTPPGLTIGLVISFLSASVIVALIALRRAKSTESD